MKYGIVQDFWYWFLVRLLRLGRKLYGAPATNGLVADAKGDAHLYPGQ